MQSESAFGGTIRYVRAHWPRFTVLYGGIVAMLLVFGLSVEAGWYSLAPIATATLLLLAYFFVASLWQGHQLFDRSGVRPHHALFDMGNLKSTDSFVYVDLGIRRRPVGLSRRLTTGKVIVVDIYNPQWMTGRSLKRWRHELQHPLVDRRLSWRDGQMNLLPLPDQSVPAVILCQVVSAFWQRGDQLALLQEVHRILAPNGLLLLAEQCRSQVNWVTLGPGAFPLTPDNYWQTLLHEAGFRIRADKTLKGVVHCFRAQKPTQAEARQLTFDLAL